mgnify:CR=1 FL=1|jgi:dCTP deaminase
MAFWSGEELAQHLPTLITGFTKENLDCASYRLSVGDQVFATSDKFATSSPSAALVSVLKDPPENILRIRPGQFAFLMTLESVTIPNDALALISIRAGYKFKGLINVSGFHVDPGWSGKLLFSVYNAGPTVVTLKRGEPMFLIVYADLDRASKKTYNGKSKGQVDIDASLLENMTEQVFSPLMLQRQLAEIEKIATATASTVSVATKTLISIVGLLLAFYAILATFAPGSLGVVLAKTLESAGYEIKQKQSEAVSSASVDSRRPIDEAVVVEVPPKASGKASEGALGKEP